MANKQFSTVDEYIDSFPENTQTIPQKIRETIHHTIPQATETISYNIPTFKLHNSYIVYFSAYPKHISLYPWPKSATMDRELEPFKSGKGTLHFPLDEPIPYDLIKKITLALAEDNQRRTS